MRCKRCGRPAGFFSDCHPECARAAIAEARAQRVSTPARPEDEQVAAERPDIAAHLDDSARSTPVDPTRPALTPVPPLRPSLVPWILSVFVVPYFVRQSGDHPVGGFLTGLIVVGVLSGIVGWLRKLNETDKARAAAYANTVDCQGDVHADAAASPVALAVPPVKSRRASRRVAVVFAAFLGLAAFGDGVFELSAGTLGSSGGPHDAYLRALAAIEANDYESSSGAAR